ncbi:MAG: transglycosylase SLT domain-containing protein [Bacteroidia bacterium]|nr:transglycosylase SLT domain-containing protein [Bacteroidia bacterium]
MRWILWLSSWALVWGQNWSSRLAAMDSLMRAYLAWQRDGGDMSPMFAEPTPLSPEEFEERLQALHTTIPLEANPISLQFTYMYLYKQTSLSAQLLGLADYYLPVIEPILRAYGLPPELQYLPVIESAFIPEALSPMAAAGIWQFIPATGRLYGLRVDRIIDERYDLVKSTHAAARYLRDSYQILGDWLLVIAAYNCGTAGVVRAIKRSGGRTNYWEIAPYLPIETRGYVPAFIAACYVMNYAQAHGIQPIFPDIPREVDTVFCPIRTRLSIIASAARVPLAWLKFYNAELRADIVPAGYILRVPTVAAHEVSEAIIRMERGELMLQPVSQTYSTSKGILWHTVRPGESLYRIAREYRVSPYQIVRWNQLWGYRVFPGMKLRIKLQGEINPEIGDDWGLYMEGEKAWQRSYLVILPYIIPKFVPFYLPMDKLPPIIPEPPTVGPPTATPRKRRR